MKKILFLIIISLSTILFNSCNVNIKQDEEVDNVSIIMPTGTPALGLATYANNLIEAGGNVDIVAGSDLLVAAFNQGTYDVVVAPVNLGAKMYQTNGKYILATTFVWGNLYLASKKEINSLEDLNNKEVVVFGKNSTPDIVFQTLLKSHPDLNITISYASDVSEANSLLVAGKADYCISAEPSLSKLKKNLNLYTIDLQDEWAKITGNSSYPQAGIFVKKELKNETYIRKALQDMKKSINDIISNPNKGANDAVKIHKSFETLGVDTLINAIPNCHFEVLSSDKEAVLFYLQQMMDLGFTAQMGGVLPDEDFFY